MEVINGWAIDRDGRGFWAVHAEVRQGPYPRRSEAQDFARKTPIIVYEIPKPRKTLRRDEPNDDGE